MIKMNCPSCGHSLRISDEYSGKRGKCKYCNEIFIVSGVQADPQYGEDEATQRERQRKEREVAKMAQAGQMLAEARAVEAARLREKREREDRRSHRFLILTVVLIVGLLAGGGYWFMDTTGRGIPGVYLPKKAMETEEPVQSAELLGVPVPIFGEDAKPLDVSIEWAEAFKDIEKDKITCFQIPVSGDYTVIVSEVQLALTRLGWDFTIWMGEEPVAHTELYGGINGRRAALRIEDVADEVYVYAGILPE